MQRAFADRSAWRAWLAKNHAKVAELWLVYYKKGSGKASVDYGASVEEALCFGWIDGLKKRIDERRYTHRFTPRRPGSRWSAQNIERVKRLIAEGRMEPAGLAVYKPEKRSDKGVRAAVAAAEAALPAELAKALRANPKAWKHFRALAPSYRRQYIGWLVMAKRPETRRKRLAEALELLERNEKLGMR